MKYYFCELSENEKLTEENIDSIETWADYDIEADDQDAAIDVYGDWLDENNDCKNEEDIYHCAVVNEEKEVRYFRVKGQIERCVTWGWEDDN